MTENIVNILFRPKFEINVKQSQDYQITCLEKYRIQVNKLLEENMDLINNENSIARKYIQIRCKKNWRLQNNKYKIEVAKEINKMLKDNVIEYVLKNK